MKKKIAVLGSTGSIGTQTLEVIATHQDVFEVEALCAHSNTDLLIEQSHKFKPNAVVVTHEDSYDKVKKALSALPIKVFKGNDALCDIVKWDTVDIVLNAIVGFAGLHSTLAAVDAGKTIAIANKETLVVAGELVVDKAIANKSLILPVDSEHSAIYQCLVGESLENIEKVVLTASGGPFFGKKTNFLVNVKKDHALQHPNWTMGAKITIDSATLMNKGLEMIEAKWLFGLEDDQIDVVIHQQSVIHSLVQFNDGSVKAQLGLPDMKLPIQYALAYPNRVKNDYKRLDIKEFSKLTFDKPDYKTFRNLQLAKDAMIKGGNIPCALNAANEVVVSAFLENKIGFLEMSDVIENVVGNIGFEPNAQLTELIETDGEARKVAKELVAQSSLYN